MPCMDDFAATIQAALARLIFDPESIGQKSLEGADSRPANEGNRLDNFVVEVAGETFAVGCDVGMWLAVEK
jgi:hypothetical protein